MERLICDMMQWAKVTPEQLCEKGEITTEFGQTLSWRYLCWVRQHPLDGWRIRTAILYAGQDTIDKPGHGRTAFAQKHHAELDGIRDRASIGSTPRHQLDAMRTWERGTTVRAAEGLNHEKERGKTMAIAMLAGYLVIINAAALLMMAEDKTPSQAAPVARAGSRTVWRSPAGRTAPGDGRACICLHHKTKHWYFA